ncbi:hypothetical protein GCM10022254_32130 [Actinomadura meridiana]|uniref:Uncharacterized protein n=1 Tax=Actinomadura meridiana TaxID=559626 RepID=A0ABP8C2D4_9ACTN
MHVHPEGAVELLGVDLADVVHGLLRAVVQDEDVQAAEPFDRLGDDIPGVAFVGQVAAEGRAAAALGLDETGGVPGVAVLLQVGLTLG